MAGAVVHLNDSAIQQVLSGQGGAVYRDLQRRTLAVHARATDLCPVDTGRLRSSIRWTIQNRNGQLVGVVGSDVEYASFINSGTRRMAARPFLTEALEAARK